MVKLPNVMKAQGYTLIEVLIVLFIISIVTSVALLSIGRSENRELETVANELAETITFAEEKAMLEPTVLGLSLDAHAFQFSRYQVETDEKKNPWAPIKESFLGHHAIPNDIEMRVEMGGERVALAASGPQIIISTNGDITPFTIYLGKAGEKPRYVIKGDADGNITHKLLS